MDSCDNKSNGRGLGDGRWGADVDYGRGRIGYAFIKIF